ncbi:MAG: hypothetical protein ACQPRH_00975 [Solitalea-like symbiont of Tyrophagus putrescentiae]
MKKKFTLKSFLAVTIAIFTTLSCQKNEGFISEKQVGKSNNTETTLSSTPTDNLPRPGNPDKNTRDWFGDIMMPNAAFTRIEFNKQNGDYNVSINLKYLSYEDLSMIQTVDKEYGFHVGLWDYALEKQWWFIKTWHEKHTLDAKVDKDTNSINAKIPSQEMFAGKGIGERQLCIYLSKKNLGMTFYKKLHTIYYTEGTKDIFDNLININKD